LIFNIVLGDRKTVKVSGDRKAIDVPGNREAVNTIFSPEDDTPFPRMPPSPREGRSRFWREKAKKQGSNEVKKCAADGKR